MRASLQRPEECAISVRCSIMRGRWANGVWWSRPPRLSTHPHVFDKVRASAFRGSLSGRHPAKDRDPSVSSKEECLRVFQTQMFLRLTIQRERDDRFRRYDIVLEAGPLETPPMLSPLGGQGGTNGWETNRRSLSSIEILVLRPILRDDLRYRLVGTAQ